MKKKLIIFLFMIILVNSIFSNEENQKEIKYTNHFIDIFAISAGYTFVNYTFDNTSNTYINLNSVSNGFNFGYSGGYMYSFTKNVGFGGGLSLSIPGIFFNVNNNISFALKISVLGTLLFMFGDLQNKKIAFLLDIGVGWLAGIKFGILLDKLTIKIGYSLSGMAEYHSFSIEFGLKINVRQRN